MKKGIRPFLKWAGGKQQLLPELRRYSPIKFNEYFEPFLGSGALFFYLLPTNAIISDANEELINCFKVVRDNLDDLVSSLEKYKNIKEYFYNIRAQDPLKLSLIERASRFIYLNRTCFNGLYRVNKKGQFNVPFGNYKNPDIVQIERLKKASNVLLKTNILIGDYHQVLKQAKAKDFIYLDPPYYTRGGFSDFKRYHKDFFEKKDHEELAKVYKHLDNKGCFVMLSNSDTDFTRSLYSKWQIITVSARRLINCDATKRGKINEILVINYKSQYEPQQKTIF